MHLDELMLRQGYELKLMRSQSEVKDKTENCQLAQLLGEPKDQPTAKTILDTLEKVNEDGE